MIKVKCDNCGKTLWSNRVNKLDALWRKPGRRFYRRTIAETIAELMKPNERMLDVGCGTGLLYHHLPAWVKKTFTGVDFTPEFIQLCRKRYPQGKWEVEDALNLSFSDNSFYLVNSTTLLQHIPDWKKAASELVRVSKKYVLSTCRTHLDKTKIVTMNPVLRRRFNPWDIVSFYEQYGTVTWKWVRYVDGSTILGMYSLTKGGVG